jgi:hypothetical protein
MDAASMSAEAHELGAHPVFGAAIEKSALVQANAAIVFKKNRVDNASAHFPP